MIEEVKVDRLEELVDAIVAGAGSGLPKITESDEGKVLTVDNGEATWSPIESGGSNVYEDGVYNDIGTVTFHTDGATVNWALKTYILECGFTKYAKIFDITLPTADEAGHVRPSEIISAWAACKYNSSSVNIPIIIWAPEGSPTQTAQFCFDSADGQMDLPNTGIYIKRIYLMGYGTANV